MKKIKISSNSMKVLNFLKESDKPLSAYDILAGLKDTDIKAPPTVYRALDNLLKNKLIHRIESLNSFVACDEHDKSHSAQFAVCKSCGDVEEIHDKKIASYLKKIAKKIDFQIEEEILELSGFCKKCSH